MIFAREPMDRLVNAWRDKFNKTENNQYYHSKFGKTILEQKYYKQISDELIVAWDQG